MDTRAVDAQNANKMHAKSKDTRAVDVRNAHKNKSQIDG